MRPDKLPTISTPGCLTGIQLRKMAGFTEAVARLSKKAKAQASKPRTDEERRAWLKKLGLIP